MDIMHTVVVVVVVFCICCYLVKLVLSRSCVALAMSGGEGGEGTARETEDILWRSLAESGDNDGGYIVK